MLSLFPWLATNPAMANLPEEIIFEILSRLPVLSLCRFRCVSKPWRSLISHPRFIAAHLNRNSDNKRERLILGWNLNLYSVELESSQFGHQSKSVHLNFPQDQDPIRCDEIGGSCDGLVLILTYWLHCFLVVNPSTREVRKIPLPPFRLYLSYGLGYDYNTDDYKVVSISHHTQPRCADNVVNVYALKTNSWRRIENSPYDHYSGPESGAFVCGALHWVSSSSKDIVALDLADEKFQTLPSRPGCSGGRLCVLGGCLCVFVDQFHPRQDLWMMKDYGVRDSWTKIVTVTHNGSRHSLSPLTLSRTDQVLFSAEEKEFVVFEPCEEKSKELVVQGRPSQFEVGTYLESLVSPNRQH